ncbi:glycosyltransferase family 87 protein [Agarilytica rhodophyticola]|uniref:glycosyltransferase family 87 protein n=1 Tax=Agarilytica rhodophyticola TaxID=1737490 RepID=UPI000B344736|nr:glycosyltransferase family 87 protein [Agarilytica rhodophyticola]
MILFSKKVDAYLSLLGVAAAVIFLYLFGIHGFLRSAPFGLDFGVFHKAAVLFLNGGNPWLELMNSGEPFSYPPHTASVLAVYGYLSKPIALGIHTAINISSIAAMAFLANKWYLKITDLRSMNLAQGVGFAVIIGNPFMAHSVFEGQLVLPTAAATMLSWYFLNSGSEKKHLLFSGIFLGIATIKPQVSLLYIVWLLLSANFAVLFIGAATALLLLIPAFVAFGPIEAFANWLTSLSGYSSVSVNQPGSVHVVGIESFFVAMGIQGTGIFVKPLSLLATLILFRYRKCVDPILTVNLFLVFALTFIYGHDTDYAAIIMICSFILFLALQSASLQNILIAGILLAGFFFPQRILREYDIPFMHHLRTWLIPVCCYFIFIIQKTPTKNKKQAYI